MLKKIIILACFAVILLAQIAVSKRQVNDANLYQAISKVGIDKGEVNIIINGTYEKSYMNENEQGNAKKYIVDGANLSDGNVAISFCDGNYYIFVDATYEVEDVNKQARQIVEKKDAITKLCKDAGFIVNSSMSFCGESEGQTSEIMQQQIIKEFMGSLGCEQKQISRLNSEKMDCICYGYSPLIKSYQKVGNAKVNITIAITYDEENDVTKIYFATPILNASL